jgi:hypothetical protein
MNKRITAFLFAFMFLFASLSYAQLPIFTDYFDSYTVGGQLACQNGTDWTTWSNAPCGAEDPVISNAFSSSVSNSVLIAPNRDLVKTLPNFTDGNYSVVFKFYIPAGKSGYFNVLHLFAGAGSNWAFECYFDANATGRVNAGGTNAATFNYTQGVWHTIEVKANMAGTNDIGSFYIDGTTIHTWTWSAGAAGSGGIKQLGGVNLYGAAATEEMYVDNFQIWDNIIPVELTSFTASAGNGNVTLNWTTASEINNRGFEVERRTVDGKTVTLGFVQGAGTTTEIQNYTFVDKSVLSDLYYYRIKQVDFDGRYEYSDEVEVDAFGEIAFGLVQNYPNPFNPSTLIKYNLPQAGFVNLAVYNSIGEEVALLVNSQMEAGIHEISFNAGNLPSGIYIYRLQMNDQLSAKKMLLTK